MNLGEIKTRVQVGAGDEAGVFVESEDITAWANDAQIEINRVTEVVRATVPISTVVGQRAYPVPADFIHEKRVTYQNTRLSYYTIEYLDNFDELSTPGTPYGYYIDGQELGLYPVPSSAITDVVSMNYVRIPARLVTDTDIPELPEFIHPEIVRLALAKAKEKDEDFDAAQQIETDVYARLAVVFDITKHGSGSSFPAIREV